MPLSSAEIAQLNGAFLQQQVIASQYSNAMQSHGPSLYGGLNRPMNAEGLAGAALNRGMAVGAPMAMAGLALAGMDPASIAFRTGVSAHAAGMGFGGAALTGVAAGLPMALGLGALSYMGGQMMTGARQGQAFHQDLHSAYHFVNPANPYGGRGFTHSDTREIGGMVRALGSSGYQGFDELGRLASQMGRMGLAEGVRNARDFGEKFRDMLSSLKVMAKELGSTLEEAQTAMASLRGSGVFGKHAPVAQQIRQSAISGGLATSEVTGMMSAGSQIARMYGGSGRAGAMGGMEAITQVGVARQLGVLRDEDIYNATGLTGAEGRRSLAMRQLEVTGNFLRSSKGRWFLASVAGRDGQLDPESVASWMAGDMSVGSTRAQAHRNLGRVGRANFIRNEGRLRGAVMQEFGGLAPAMAMLQWAGSRGIDINDMDDRAMLFASRHLGLGRDETDVAIQMARRMPEMLRSRRLSREDDTLVRERGDRLKLTGIEGIKTRFEKAKNALNNEMQRAGQDIFNSLSDTIAAWANGLADTYEERSVEGVREAYRAASLGGSGGQRMLRGLLGGGGAGLRTFGSAAGLPTSGGVREDIGQLRYRDKIRELRFSANMGELGELSDAGKQFATEHRGALRRAYTGGVAALTGEDRVAAMRQMLRKQGGALYDQFKGMTEGERAAFVQQVERHIGIQEGSRIGDVFQDPELPALRGSGERTLASSHEREGRQLLGLERDRSFDWRIRGSGFSAYRDLIKRNATQASDVIGQVGTAAFFGAPVVAGSALAGALQSNDGFFSGLLRGARRGAADIRQLGRFAGNATEEALGHSKRARAASEFLDTSEGREMMVGLLSGADGATTSAEDELIRLQARTARGDKLTEEDKGRFGALQRGLLATRLRKTVDERGDLKKLTDQDWAPLLRDATRILVREGVDSAASRDTVIGMHDEVARAVHQQQARVVSTIASQVRKTSREHFEELRAGGFAELDKDSLKLTKRTRERLSKEGGTGAVQAAELALAAENVGSRVIGREDTSQADSRLLERKAELSGEFYERLGNMSARELRGFARVGAGTDLGGIASEQLMLRQRLSGRLRRARARGGGAAEAIAGELGVRLSRDELAGLKGLSSTETAARLAQRLGVSSDEGFRGELAKVITAAEGRDGAGRASSLLTRALAQADKSTRDKLSEAQGRGPDPLEKIAEKIAAGNQYLEALVKSNAAAERRLSEIVGNTRPKDGEKN